MLENENETRKNEKLIKQKRKYKIQLFIECFAIWAIAIIFILALIALIALEIYVWVRYGNTPSGEIPGWVLFLMLRK